MATFIKGIFSSNYALLQFYTKLIAVELTAVQAKLLHLWFIKEISFSSATSGGDCFDSELKDRITNVVCSTYRTLYGAVMLELL